jgi:hypothetical protein
MINYLIANLKRPQLEGNLVIAKKATLFEIYGDTVVNLFVSSKQQRRDVLL